MLDCTNELKQFTLFSSLVANSGFKTRRQDKGNLAFKYKKMSLIRWCTITVFFLNQCTLIPGDGVGPEMMQAVQEVLEVRN